MLRCGDVPKFAYLWLGERQTHSNPKGIYDRFPCRGGDEILFLGRYQTHTHIHAQYQNGRTMGEGGGEGKTPSVL
jgi:hypothetical protein